MFIKTIKRYRDKQTKKVYDITDKDFDREVADARGLEIIKAGYAVKFVEPITIKEPEETTEEKKIVDELVEENEESVVEEEIDEAGK